MKERLRRWLPAIVVFGGFIAGWELTVQIFKIKGFILPAPSAIIAAMPGAWPDLWPAAIGTFSSALAGLAVGTIFAVLAAICAARWPAGSSRAAG